MIKLIINTTLNRWIFYLTCLKTKQTKTKKTKKVKISI